jgi:hypothetical protein
MRKSLLILLASFSLVLLLPFYVFAQDETIQVGEQKRIEAKERVEQKQIVKEDVRAEIQKRVEERKASQEAKVQQIRQERIRNYWGILAKRITATIDRLDILIARIESRLSKMTQDDPELDVSAIEAKIEEAKELIAEAKLMLDEANTDLENLLESENPKTAFEILRNTLKDIKDTLIEAHRILVHLIGDIKGLRVGSEGGVPTSAVTPTIYMSPTPEVSPEPEPEE